MVSEKVTKNKYLISVLIMLAVGIFTVSASAFSDYAGKILVLNFWEFRRTMLTHLIIITR